ncbi:MAG: hypothetical protein VCD33_16555 [Alphaproteobacteria bacterium]
MMNIGLNRHSSPSRRSSLLLSAAVAATLILAAPAMTLAAQSELAWTPQPTERLVKLPASYLKKSLDYDFAQSGLGQAIRDVDLEVGFKVLTLGDLQAAVERADGEVRDELRHQFLAEKREYLELMSRKNDLRRQYAETKKKTLERMLDRMGLDSDSLSPARADLIASQDAARDRFEASVTEVDVKIFETAVTAETKYAREYATNLTAIETLVRAIQEHPMNVGPVVDGAAVTKEDYIRQMLGDTQADLSLLDQEGKVIGYMAKLVALDAMALSEDVMDAELVDSDVTDATSVTSAVGFFVSTQ